MKLKFFYALIGLLVCTNLYTQVAKAQVMIAPPGRSELYIGSSTDTPYTQQVDLFVQNLDKTLITTGILYDRSFPIANLDLKKYP